MDRAAVRVPAECPNPRRPLNAGELPQRGNYYLVGCLALMQSAPIPRIKDLANISSLLETQQGRLCRLGRFTVPARPVFPTVGIVKAQFWQLRCLLAVAIV